MEGEEKYQHQLINSAIYELYSFIGIYNFSKGSFFCYHNRDNLFKIAEKQICEQFIAHAIQFISGEELDIFLKFFEWNPIDTRKKKEMSVHFITEENKKKVYRIQMIFSNEKDVLQSVILMQRSKEDEVRNDVQDYMAAVSRLAFSAHYVLVGVRDLKRRFYENIYDAENILALPRVCDFETFSRQIDSIIYPEDMPIYQQYIRNCDNEDMTKADFRMYDTEGDLHEYQGITCRIKTPVGVKHLFLLRNIDKIDKEQARSNRRKKDQSQQIGTILSGIRYGFDTLVHLNIKTEQYTIYEKQGKEKKIVETRRDFFKNARERIEKLVHEEDKALLLEKFDLHYLQEYFLKHDLLETEYRKKNDEGGYDWSRMWGRRIDKNKKVKDIVFCMISVSEEYGKNLTERLKIKYLCDILEEQNEYLNKTLQKAALESDIKDNFKRYLAYEIDTACFYMNYLYDWMKSAEQKDAVKTLLHCMAAVSDNMDVMKDNILMIPEIEKGILKVNYKETCLEKIITRAYENARVECWIRQQELFLEMPELSDEYVDADGYRTYQILLNMLTNEIRLAGAGARLFLTVSRTRLQKEGKCQYVFSIENSESFDINQSNELCEEEQTRYRYRLYVIRQMALLLKGDMFISDHEKSRKITLTFEWTTLCNGDKN